MMSIVHNQQALITINPQRKKSRLLWEPDQGPSWPFTTCRLPVLPLAGCPKQLHICAKYNNV